MTISDTSLDRIPKEFVDKGFRFITDEENGGDSLCVYMKDVELFEQPVSLFSQPRELIEAYYQEEPDLVNEAKVIFLGDGGVGKTYTIYRIEHGGEAPEGTETTPGVSITQYERDGKATINFWDFGGQEIMRSMHRCFLTERTCYVIMVSNRWSEVARQARRWLKNIESFAPDSKVILAVNQWEGVSVWDVDKGRLKEEFSNLQEAVEYDARDPNDIERLKRRIELEVDKLYSVNMQFPKSWAEIMEKLRNMTDDSGKPSNYITMKQYQNICETAKLKVVDKISLWLLEWFNDLGVCFSYHKNAEDGSELANYMILNPEWLTNAVSIIVNNGQRFAQQGRVTYEGIREILNRPQKYVVEGLTYSEDELRYILEVMRKFRLSFKVDDDQEFVPALCSNETPKGLHPREFKSRVRCEVRYDYLPDSVVHRLMCDCSKDLIFEKCWLKGLCINNVKPYGLVAVCDMGKDDDVLYVDVYQLAGNGDLQSLSPQYLLRSLLDKIEKINNESNLKSTIWICSEDGKAAFQLSTLLKALKEGDDAVRYTQNGGYEKYNVRQLLGQVFDVSPEMEFSKWKDSIVAIVDKRIQENYFLKSIKEKQMEKTPINVTTYGSGSPVNIIQDSQGAKIVNNESSSEFAEKLEQFKDELHKLVELSEDQNAFLNEALANIAGSLNASEEKRKESKDKFDRVVRIIDAMDKTLDIFSKIKKAATKVGLLSLFG